MTLTVELAPILAIIAGVLILALPQLLNYIVAGYLILYGVVSLLKIA